MAAPDRVGTREIVHLPRVVQIYTYAQGVRPSILHDRWTYLCIHELLVRMSIPYSVRGDWVKSDPHQVLGRPYVRVCEPTRQLRVTSLKWSCLTFTSPSAPSMPYSRSEGSQVCVFMACAPEREYRGASLIRKRHPPKDYHRALVVIALR